MKIREELQITVNLADNQDIRRNIDQIAKFSTDNKEVVDNVDGADQRQLVRVYYDINLKGNHSTSQSRILFRVLSDRKPPTINLGEALELTVLEHSSMLKTVIAAGKLGMIFKNDLSKGGDVNPFEKRKSTERQDDNKRVKTDLEKNNEFCSKCGFTGHSSNTCHSEAGPYTNDKGGKYGESAAWAKVLKDYPQALKILRTPKRPNAKTIQLLKNLSERQGNPHPSQRFDYSM
jgi:hypothetical protein